MADITDPAAAKFVKEEVRQLSEAARALKARILSLQTKWFAGMNVTIPNTADHVVEGRLQLEGVADLTGAQVTGAVGQLLGAAGALNDEIISIPCVRTLKETL